MAAGTRICVAKDKAARYPRYGWYWIFVRPAFFRNDQISI